MKKYDFLQGSKNESELSCSIILRSIWPAKFATHLNKIKYGRQFFVALLTEHDVYLCFQVRVKSLDEIILML